MPEATIHPTADSVFEALGDATRRRIIEHLSSRPKALSELREPLGITLSAILQHIQFLERRGLVATRREGRQRICQLAPDGFNVADAWINQRKAVMERKLDRLDLLLKETDNSEPG